MQTLLITLLFVAAVAFLGRRAFRSLRRDKGGCGKGCGCAPAAAPPAARPTNR